MKNTGRTAAVLAALLVIWGLGPGVVRLIAGKPAGIADFYQEWSSARSYWLGQPLYQETVKLVPRDFGPRVSVEGWLLGRNVHPPTAVLLGLPFGRWSYADALFAWNLLGVACLVGAVLLLTCSQRPLAWQRLLILPALLLLSPHLASQFIYGQLSLILLLLLTGAGVAYVANRRGLAGALIGVAAAVKVFPAVLGWLFLVRRDTRGLIGVIGGFGIATAITCGVLGTAAYRDYLRDVLPEALGWRSAATNSSIPGLWSKLFDPGPRGGHVVPLRVDPLLARGLTALCAGVILAAWGWMIVRSQDERDRQIAFAVGCLAMLLLSPIAWEHYTILLLPALVYLWNGAEHNGERRLAIVSGIVLINVPIHRWIVRTLPELRTEEGVDAVRMLGIPSLTLYGLLALFGIGVWLAAGSGTRRVRGAGDLEQKQRADRAPRESLEVVQV